MLKANDKSDSKKESFKDKIDNLFDGDDSNSNNVIDRVGHQMLDKNNEDKIDELLHIKKQ